MLWYESYPFDSPQGAEIMDKMAQGQHLGTTVFKDLRGFPATHPLAKPPTTTTPVRALLLASVCTASIDVINDSKEQGTSTGALISTFSTLKDAED